MAPHAKQMACDQRAMAGLLSVVNVPPPEPCRPCLPPLAGRRRYHHPGDGDRFLPRKRVEPLPPPLERRIHQYVQTELYLEELWRHPDTRDVASQTDVFLERPESPAFVAAKTGVDAETQVLPGELFDFDVEVVPILEVLADKIMEQALIEVLEEEEMAELLAQQRRHLASRDAELAERQRLEDQERRLREETDRSIAQAREALRHQAEARERVAAAVLVRGHLRGLFPSVLQGLADAGVLVDDVRADVVDGFIPWLADHVERRVGSTVQSRMVLDDVLREILVEQRRIYFELGERVVTDEQTPLSEPVPPQTETPPTELPHAEGLPDESEDPADTRERLEEPEANVDRRPVIDTNKQFSTILEEPEDLDDE